MVTKPAPHGRTGSFLIAPEIEPGYYGAVIGVMNAPMLFYPVHRDYHLLFCRRKQ
jgi:hypothetical protein